MRMMDNRGGSNMSKDICYAQYCCMVGTAYMQNLEGLERSIVFWGAGETCPRF